MAQVWAAQVTVDTCEERHVHITMHPSEADTDCLGVAMSPDEAREFAEAVLNAATSLSPLN